MTTRTTLRTIAMACLLLAAGFVVDDTLAPWLPVAGVARRTTRRRIRRSTIFIATLPRGCSQVNIEGTVLMSCGGTYYQASGSQYVVVYVD